MISDLPSVVIFVEAKALLTNGFLKQAGEKGTYYKRFKYQKGFDSNLQVEEGERPYKCVGLIMHVVPALGAESQRCMVKGRLNRGTIGKKPTKKGSSEDPLILILICW